MTSSVSEWRETDRRRVLRVGDIVAVRGERGCTGRIKRIVPDVPRGVDGTECQVTLWTRGGWRTFTSERIGTRKHKAGTPEAEAWA